MCTNQALKDLVKMVDVFIDKYLPSPSGTGTGTNISIYIDDELVETLKIIQDEFCGYADKHSYFNEERYFENKESKEDPGMKEAPGMIDPRFIYAMLDVTIAFLKKRQEKASIVDVHKVVVTEIVEHVFNFLHELASAFPTALQPLSQLKEEKPEELALLMAVADPTAAQLRRQKSENAEAKLFQRQLTRAMTETYSDSQLRNIYFALGKDDDDEVLQQDDGKHFSDAEETSAKNLDPPKKVKGPPQKLRNEARSANEEGIELVKMSGVKHAIEEEEKEKEVEEKKTE
jgi:hypothetical protein